MRYYDASALVKLYVSEVGGSGVRLMIRTDALPCTSAVSGAEVPAAIAQAMRMVRLTQAGAEEAIRLFQREWLAEYLIVPLDTQLGAAAGELAWRHGLRGFDAAHLASAKQVERLYGERVTLVTYDRRLWQASKAEGMDVFPTDLDAVLADT